jgi:hypothetical protein
VFHYLRSLLCLTSFGRAAGAPRPRPTRKPKTNRRRPTVEGLEDRTVPSATAFPTAQQVVASLVPGAAGRTAHHGHHAHHAHHAPGAHHHGATPGSHDLNALALSLATLQAQVDNLPGAAGNQAPEVTGSSATPTAGTTPVAVTPTPVEVTPTPVSTTPLSPGTGPITVRPRPTTSLTVRPSPGLVTAPRPGSTTSGGQSSSGSNGQTFPAMPFR